MLHFLSISDKKQATESSSDPGSSPARTMVQVLHDSSLKDLSFYTVVSYQIKHCLEQDPSPNLLWLHHTPNAHALAPVPLGAHSSSGAMHPRRKLVHPNTVPHLPSWRSSVVQDIGRGWVLSQLSAFLTHIVESSEQHSEPLLLAQKHLNTLKFILHREYPVS